MGIPRRQSDMSIRPHTTSIMARPYTSAPAGAGAGVAGTADGRSPRELPVTSEQADAPLLAARKIEIWNDVTSMNWSEFRPFAALACLPAVVLLIACGLALGDMTAALAASSGALVVGFGAFQQDFRHPIVPMLLVCLGMSFSAGIGTLAHASLPLDLTCVALWGFGLGLMNIVGRGPGWLALQGSTALVIAAAFPATPVYAAWRFILVLAGGAVQLAIVLAIRRLAPGHLFAPATNASFTMGSILSQIRDMIASRAPGRGHAITMALAVSAAELLYRVLDMPNGYWVPMTVLLILRPVA